MTSEEFTLIHFIKYITQLNNMTSQGGKQRCVKQRLTIRHACKHKYVQNVKEL